MNVRVFRVDEKGRVHIPKNVRERLGIKGDVRASIEGGKLVIEPTSDLFDRLGRQVKFNFRSIHQALPSLRKAAQEQLVREIS